MNIITQGNSNNSKRKGKRWEHPVRDKLEDVFCVDTGKTFTRPGLIEQKVRSKKVSCASYNYGGKKLTENYLQGVEVLAVRQMHKIKLLALDIDKGSKYRHDYVGIVHALEEIGLCRYTKLLSSVSGGLHIYFPLKTAVNSEFLHVSTKAWLEHRGFEVGDGTLEIFPNAKGTQWRRDNYGNWTIEHLSRCFRLPLQEGSYVLDEDENIIHCSKERFWLSEFDWCADGQDTEGFLEYLNHPLSVQIEDELLDEPIPEPKRKAKRGRPSRVSKEQEAIKAHMASLDVNPRSYIQELRALVKQGWTNTSQSNHLIGAVAILASYDNRDYDEKQLAKVIQWEAQRLPGYEEFASHESKKDLGSESKRSWAGRWAKSVVKYRSRINSGGRLSSVPSAVG